MTIIDFENIIYLLTLQKVTIALQDKCEIKVQTLSKCNCVENGDFRTES
jgi:hypothetical protein